jgi:hypothetical protein
MDVIFPNFGFFEKYPPQDKIFFVLDKKNFLVSFMNFRKILALEQKKNLKSSN